MPSTIEIHSVVNVSRIHRYNSQVEGQQKKKPQPVIIEGEEECEVEKILNKRKVQGKNKYLVWWKGFIAERDTWESRENLKNAEDLLREFEEEYRRNNREVRRQQRAEDDRDYWRGRSPG